MGVMLPLTDKNDVLKNQDSYFEEFWFLKLNCLLFLDRHNLAVDIAGPILYVTPVN